jgi:UDP-N-acetylglucosamine--N-acetylmuramyl-(pentapeptide) pyrophosphoryl-undecaprenol N-acetylglucosamine transferase
LVLGGSLGARRVNQLIEKNWKAFKTKMFKYGNGKLYFEEYKINSTTVQVVAEEWILYMHLDIIISRQGVISVGIKYCR